MVEARDWSERRPAQHIGQSRPLVIGHRAALRSRRAPVPGSLRSTPLPWSGARDRASLGEGWASLCRLLVVTGLLAPLLIFGMVKPILATWWPPAATSSALWWQFLVVWLAVLAWTASGLVRR